MVEIALFEDHFWGNFIPLSHTRPLFDLNIGSKTFFEQYELPPNCLLVRDYLAEITEENHPNCCVNPSVIDSDTLFLNALIDPRVVDIEKLASIGHTFSISVAGRLIAAKLSTFDREYLRANSERGIKVNPNKFAVEKSKSIDAQSEMMAGLFTYPWEIIRNLENSLILQTSQHIKAVRDHGSILSESSLEKRGLSIKGEEGAFISPLAEVEEGTVIDVKKGPVVIEQGVKISPCRIVGPTFVDSNSQIKQYSLISASFIGKECRISGEIESSVISDYSNKAHTGYVGHSYIGSWVNIGAMTTTSDLKMTYGDIHLDLGKMRVNSGMNKLGSFLGDMVKTSIGTMIYSGRKIGVSSQVHGLISSDIPSFTIAAKSLGAKDVELQLDSALQTQQRMMARRNINMSAAFEKMLRALFDATAKERMSSKIRKAKFSIP